MGGLGSGGLLVRKTGPRFDAVDERQGRVHELRIALGTHETALSPVEVQHPRPHDPRRSREAEEHDHPPLLGEAALEKTECEIEHV